MQRLHPRGNHDLADIESLRDGDLRRIEAQHVDIAQRDGVADWIDHPDCRLSIDSRQRARSDLDHWSCVHRQPAGDGRAQPHAFRRIDESDLHLECPGHRIGLRRDFAYATARHDRRVVGEIDRDDRIARR